MLLCVDPVTDFPVSRVAAPGPYTVFAPINQAFDNLTIPDDELEGQSLCTSRHITSHHVTSRQGRTQIEAEGLVSQGLQYQVEIFKRKTETGSHWAGVFWEVSHGFQPLS